MDALSLHNLMQTLEGICGIQTEVFMNGMENGILVLDILIIYRMCFFQFNTFIDARFQKCSLHKNIPLMYILSLCCIPDKRNHTK